MTTVQEESSVPQFAHAVRGYDRLQVDEYVQRLNEWASAAQARAAEAERQAASRAEEISRLREQIHRIESDRPTAPESAVKEAADRAAEAVTRALREADQLRRQAAADAERRLDEAGERAVAVVEAARLAMADFADQAVQQREESSGRVGAIIEQAEREADEIRSRAEAEADRVLAEARAAAEAVVADAHEAARQVREGSAEESRRAAESLQQLEAQRSGIIDDLGRLRGAIQSLIGAGEAVLPGGGDPAQPQPAGAWGAGPDATTEMSALDGGTAPEGAWPPAPGA